jgi:hypothetical protein
MEWQETVEEEEYNMTTITINGTVTFDESSSLQNTGISVPGEDNNDQDVLLSVLQSGASALLQPLRRDRTEISAPPLPTRVASAGSATASLRFRAAARSAASDSSTAQRARFCKIGL